MRPAAPIHRPQRGVSLVELLIGIAIGLMVSLAALMTLLGARTSSVTVDDSVSLQQDASLVWRVLGHHLQQAGALALVEAMPADVDVRFADDYEGLGTQALPVHVMGVNGNAGATDTLQVAYTVDPAGGSRNCASTTPVDGTLVSEFRVSNGNLVCQVPQNPNALVVGLVPGVEDFQVTYAERTGVNTTYVDTPTVWANVVAVRVCLQMVGAARGQASAATQGCQGAVADDGRLRQAFWRVFTLRNGNP